MSSAPGNPTLRHAFTLIACASSLLHEPVPQTDNCFDLTSRIAELAA